MDMYSTEIQEISKDGFQVVSAEMFQCSQRSAAPSMTLWFNSISFNKAALIALNNCERVRIEVNIEKKMILLIPVTAKDKDNVRWMKTGKRHRQGELNAARSRRCCTKTGAGIKNMFIGLLEELLPPTKK